MISLFDKDFLNSVIGSWGMFNDLNKSLHSFYGQSFKEDYCKGFEDNIPHCSCNDKWSYPKYTKNCSCEDPLYVWEMHKEYMRKEVEELGVLGECSNCPKRYTIEPTIQIAMFSKNVQPYCAVIVFERDGLRGQYGEPSEELMKKGRETIKEKGRSALCPLWLDYIKGKCVV